MSAWRRRPRDPSRHAPSVRRCRPERQPLVPPGSASVTSPARRLCPLTRWPRLVQVRNPFSSVRAHAVARLTVRSVAPESPASWRTYANPRPVCQSIRSASMVRMCLWARGGLPGWSRMATSQRSITALPVPLCWRQDIRRVPARRPPAGGGVLLCQVASSLPPSSTRRAAGNDAVDSPPSAANTNLTWLEPRKSSSVRWPARPLAPYRSRV